MDRIDHQDIGKGLHHIPQSPTDVFEAGAKIFPAMPGDQDQAFAGQ
jgi:hypothetical protein